MKSVLILLCLLLIACSKGSNTAFEETELEASPPPSFGIDSVLMQDSAQPFNGVIVVTREGKPLFAKSYGYADLDRKMPIRLDDQFMIGSVSKQITAVIILREYERGSLDLHAPIGKYLTGLNGAWKDSVRIHHLLTHTHGITGPHSRRAFTPGSQFAYSNYGYHLLAEIAESATGKTFETLAAELLISCGLEHTTFRGTPMARPVNSYKEKKLDSLILHGTSSKFTLPAGGFISTAEDLVRWNECLHGGKILADSTYRMLIGKYTVRKHNVFGELDYGYGISTSRSDTLMEISHSGYAEGFVTINYYFPESRISLVVLENIAYGPGFDQVYGHHLKILNIVRQYLHRPDETNR